MAKLRADVTRDEVADKKEVVKKVVDTLVRKPFDRKAVDPLLPKRLRDRKPKQPTVRPPVPAAMALAK